MTDGNIAKLIASLDDSEERRRNIVKDYDKAKNVNSKICSECGGECCKRCGCHFSPDDFKEISFKILKKEIEKGYISIDYVDGEMIYRSLGVYILRARNAGRPIFDTGYIRESGCILLSDKGCKLDYEHRPSGGRLLIPTKNTTKFLFGEHRICSSTYGIEECCYEWMPHQEIIYELINYFKDKDFPCSL